MQIQMIGTGSAFSKKYFNNNALIRNEDYTLLIDCGITAPLALHQLKLNPDDLDGIVITHIHGDHIGGLEEIAFQLQFIYQKKLTLYLPSTLIEPLWQHALKGAMEDRSNGRTSLEDYFHVVALEENRPYSIRPGLQIELYKTVHIEGKPSYALLFNDMLFFSSDTRFNRELIEHMANDKQCSVLFHDCQLEGKGIVHATLSELLTLPEPIQQKVRLMHYGDNMEEYIGKTGKMQFIEQQKTYTF